MISQQSQVIKTLQDENKSLQKKQIQIAQTNQALRESQTRGVWGQESNGWDQGSEGLDLGSQSWDQGLQTMGSGSAVFFRDQG